MRQPEVLRRIRCKIKLASVLLDSLPNLNGKRLARSQPLTSNLRGRVRVVTALAAATLATACGHMAPTRSIQVQVRRCTTSLDRAICVFHIAWWSMTSYLSHILVRLDRCGYKPLRDRARSATEHRY